MSLSAFVPAILQQPDKEPIRHATLNLAEALAESEEFQRFLESAQTVHGNAEVHRLLVAIRQGRTRYDQGEAPSLQSQVEALPVMRAYRRAEQAVRFLFSAVVQEISRSAGVDFLEHVHQEMNACGMPVHVVSDEVLNLPETLPEPYAEPARRLGEALHNSPEVQAYLAVQRAVREDIALANLRREVEEMEESFNVRRASGYYPASGELELYAEKQAELRQHPLLRAEEDARAQVMELFSAVHTLLSNSLGILFSELAKKPGLF
ncbi:YlbF family regulator [Anaerolinea thermophila]|uniref:Uncharacterized protein n=1 Tax=Anaerolinea thermophila (strain DSM 14523 / JCM 11388 / NBRC 100420 / UNI-1) TaxID=926569 RepID=E8N186_ANATU|nr:YlbF family regulator [Anaerolinea thermophila]BAJ64829.1 hypothetical protein ANT_28030 [Anaerolinea thermophila UNI-1]